MKAFEEHPSKTLDTWRHEGLDRSLGLPRVAQQDSPWVSSSSSLPATLSYLKNISSVYSRIYIDIYSG